MIQGSVDERLEAIIRSPGGKGETDEHGSGMDQAYG